MGMRRAKVQISNKTSDQSGTENPNTGGSGTLQNPSALKKPGDSLTIWN